MSFTHMHNNKNLTASICQLTISILIFIKNFSTRSCNLLSCQAHDIMGDSITHIMIIIIIVILHHRHLYLHRDPPVCYQRT